MKRIILPAALIALALTACGSAPAEPAQTEAAAVTTAAETAAVSETTAASETGTSPAAETTAQSAAVTTTAVTAASEKQTAATAVQTVRTTASSTSFVPVYTVTQTSVSLEQGGNGGEEHAEDIDPLYFNYLFGEDEMALRLAGGTYQVLTYDFTEALEHDVHSQYYLKDADFDGDLDLCVPVHFGNSNTEYAIFCWNAKTEYYDEQPVLIVNPVFDGEKKQITSMRHDTAVKSTLSRYAWENGTLKTLDSANIDFAMLTYVTADADGKKNIRKLESEQELQDLVNAFLK